MGSEFDTMHAQSYHRNKSRYHELQNSYNEINYLLQVVNKSDS